MLFKRKTFYTTAAIFMFIVILTSCEDNMTSTDSVTAEPEPAVQNTKPEPSPPVQKHNEGEKNRDTLEISSSNNHAGDDQASKEETITNKYNLKPYNAAHPTLMGLSIGDSKDNVTKLYGDPDDQYVMDEAFDPITVYDYEDFIVGFNNQDAIIFINITSSTVNPGLNGLHLGSQIRDAKRFLGSPDSATDFVVSYKSGDIVLKLDIDPKTHQINSIKLFSDNS